MHCGPAFWRPRLGRHDRSAGCAKGSVRAVPSTRGVLAEVPDCAVGGVPGALDGVIGGRQESGDDFVSKLKPVNFSAEKILWQHDAPGQIWAFSSPQLPIATRQ